MVQTEILWRLTSKLSIFYLKLHEEEHVDFNCLTSLAYSSWLLISVSNVMVWHTTIFGASSGSISCTQKVQATCACKFNTVTRHINRKSYSSSTKRVGYHMLPFVFFSLPLQLSFHTFFSCRCWCGLLCAINVLFWCLVRINLVIMSWVYLCTCSIDI